jgi:hypothetical protein
MSIGLGDPAAFAVLPCRDGGQLPFAAGENVAVAFLQLCCGQIYVVYGAKFAGIPEHWGIVHAT